MASEYSFDIVAEVDLTEIANAHQFAIKQIENRYDFKGKTAELEFSKGDKKVTVLGSDEYIVNAIMDIFSTQLAKREVDLRALEESSREDAPGGNVRKIFLIRDAMKQEECKKITKAIKDSKSKVRASIQGEAVRITGKSKDELQEIQRLVKGLDLECPIRFTNYR